MTKKEKIKLAERKAELDRKWQEVVDERIAIRNVENEDEYKQLVGRCYKVCMGEYFIYYKVVGYTLDGPKVVRFHHEAEKDKFSEFCFYPESIIWNSIDSSFIRIKPSEFTKEWIKFGSKLMDAVSEVEDLLS